MTIFIYKFKIRQTCLERKITIIIYNPTWQHKFIINKSNNTFQSCHIWINVMELPIYYTSSYKNKNK